MPEVRQDLQEVWEEGAEVDPVFQGPLSGRLSEAHVCRRDQPGFKYHLRPSASTQLQQVSLPILLPFNPWGFLFTCTPAQLALVLGFSQIWGLAMSLLRFHH